MTSLIASPIGLRSLGIDSSLIIQALSSCSTPNPVFGYLVLAITTGYQCPCDGIVTGAPVAAFSSISHTYEHAERWPSGRRHQIANLAYWVTGTEGSNPSLSATQSVLFAYILEGDRHTTCSFLQGPRDIASLGRCASGAAVTASPRRS